VNIIKVISPIPGYGKIVITEKDDRDGNLSTKTLNSVILVRIG
jgi:hypothetical protein